MYALFDKNVYSAFVQDVFMNSALYKYNDYNNIEKIVYTTITIVMRVGG